MENLMEKKPIYLYKILSYQNWQASEDKMTISLPLEDEAFIHLATESQLDKILTKFWSDISQFVILKLQTDRLTGELKLESNPGGSTKYYHLYQGSIPLFAIVERKLIFRK
jgi:uncharacterized protein (DUF952 family)